MRNLLLFILFFFLLLFFGFWCESKQDPYEVGSHMNYTIVCENGFVYKQTRHGTIQVLNSDGTPLKCGKKIY